MSGEYAADCLSTAEVKEISHAMGLIDEELTSGWKHIRVTKVYAEVMDVDGEYGLGVIVLHHDEDPAAFRMGEELIYDQQVAEAPEPSSGRHLALVDDDDRVIGRYLAAAPYDQDKDGY